jgi:hypothetical protein
MWSAVDWRAGWSPDVVDGVVAFFPLNSRGTSEFLVGKKCVDRGTGMDDRHAANFGAGGVCMGSQGSDFIEETFSFAVHQETEMGKKICTMSGCVTSARIKRHEKSRRKPTLRRRGSHPQYGW